MSGATMPGFRFRGNQPAPTVEEVEPAEPEEDEAAESE
jgi:hypothetical protein